MYAPRVGGDERTAIFHVVKRQVSTKQLTMYYTQLFNATKVTTFQRY